MRKKVMYKTILILLTLIIVTFTTLSLIKVSKNPEISDKTPLPSSPQTTINPTPQASEVSSPTPLLTIKPSPNPTVTTPKPTTTPTQSFSEISWGNKNKNQIIFTFDAGAGSQSLDAILNTLKKYNIKSTFCLTGNWVEKNSESTKRISQEGHEICNHTYTHPYLTQFTDQEIKNELSKTEQLIFNLTGKSTKPYFRAPYGSRDQKVLNAASSIGYRSLYWTIDALDWKESEGYTADQVKSRIYNNLQPGTIYLMHIGDNITGNILDEVISHIQSKGYKIVTLSEGL